MFVLRVSDKARMYSRIPFTLETIPRQRSFGCLSLKFGCLFSALVIILYTVLSLAQNLASLDNLIPGVVNVSNLENVLTYIFAITVILCHCVTLVLTTIMLVGTIRDKPNMMRPWVIWTSCTLLGNLLILVFMTTVNMVFDHMDKSTLIVYMAGFMGLLIRFYMLMLVSSYYKLLVEEGVERLKTLVTSDTWYNTA